jgi:branched-chain amino acid transport system permease protein
MSANRTTTAKRLTSTVLWLGWILVVTAPLMWLRLEYDAEAQKSVARFHSERWRWWTVDLPRTLIANWYWFAALTAGVVGWRLWQRFPQRERLAGWRDALLRRYRAVPSAARTAGWWVVAPIAVVTLCAALDDQQRGWGIFIGIYILLAMGLNLTVGMTGLLVLGYGAFYGIGAYTFGMLHQWTGISFWVAFVPAATVGALVGLLLGLPSIRLRGDYLAIVTLGFGEVLRLLLKNLKSATLSDGRVVTITGGDEGIFIDRAAMFPRFDAALGFPDGLTREACGFLVMAALVALSIWLVRNLFHSRIGRAWIAIREDETSASAMGIPVYRMKLLAFMLSGAWAGIAGVCFAAHQGHIVPDSFGFVESVLILSMVILGGMGTVSGPICGAAVFYLTYELLRSRVPELTDYRLLVFGALMVAMMVFRPQGLLGSQQRKIEMETGQ